MCDECDPRDRYPYYGYPVTELSKKFRDAADKQRKIAERYFIASCDWSDPKKSDLYWKHALIAINWARFESSNARRDEMETATQCRAIEYPNCPKRKRLR